MNLNKFLFENWAIKLISFGLALALWFYVTSTGKTEMTLSVPIELQNIRPGMTIVGDVTSSIEVRIQGQERVLGDSALAKKVACVLDLSTTRFGENIVAISPDDIKRPAGMTVMHMSFSEIKVRLEPLIRKTFRLRPVLRGLPAAGYRFTAASVSPVKITLEGAASAMKALEKLETMPIDIQGARESLTVEPKIDYQGKPIKLLEKNIAVRIAIERTQK